MEDSKSLSFEDSSECPYQNFLIKNAEINFSFKYLALPKHKYKVENFEIFHLI